MKKLITTAECQPCRQLKTQIDELGIDLEKLGVSITCVNEATINPDFEKIEKILTEKNIRTVPCLIWDDTVITGKDNILSFLQYQHTDTTFINLTPHNIKIFIDNSNIDDYIEIPTSGTICRVKQQNEFLFKLNKNIPVSKTNYGEIENLPPYNPDKKIAYIVSIVVANALAAKGEKRDDVFVPDTMNSVRDEKGQILGTRGLLRI